MLSQQERLKMNKALEVLLKSLQSLEQTETNIKQQITACEKELAGWFKDLEENLAAREEIKQAIEKLENTCAVKSKKVRSKSDNTN